MNFAVAWILSFGHTVCSWKEHLAYVEQKEPIPRPILP